jgi:hypothetical protein
MDPVGVVLPTPPYLPFMDGPAPSGEENFRWRLGVRPLDLRDWIELGPDADAAIAAKPRLMAEHPDTVFAALDDVEAESSEVAEALVDHLRRRWPDRYADTELDADLHPLDAAARLVPEDLILLVERGDGLVFGAGSVCFPNRWDLRSKLGLSMARVHAPVARLNEQLEAPIDGFFDRLAPDRSFWRLAWNILDTPDWYTPVDGTEAPRPPLRGPDGHYVRIERETMRRFPRTEVVLFTVRTYVAPFPAVSDGGDVAARLADAVAALPSDVKDYKGLAATADALIEHLRGNISRT